jgi:hypothetical protein
MDSTIENIDDLRLEIYRLKGVEREQSIALGKRLGTPSALFSTIFSLFVKPQSAGAEKNGGFFDQDIVSLISRVALPFLLNKTFFRRSNFIIKSIVSLLSQKASQFITEDSISGIWEVITSLFKSKSDEVPEHRALPALGETY